MDNAEDPGIDWTPKELEANLPEFHSWREKLNELIKLDKDGGTVFSLLDVQDFIEDLLEELIADIPDELVEEIDMEKEYPGLNAKGKRTRVWTGMKIREYLRRKWELDE